MKVWLVKLEEPLPTDNGYRPYRMSMLADALLRRKHSVIRWASDFDHISHKYRFGKTTTVKLSDNYTAILLNSGVSYDKSVSFMRVIDNIWIFRLFKRIALQTERPDIIVASMPTTEMAYASVQIAQHFEVPLILDARDMWPDIIESEVGGIKAWFAMPLFWWMKRNLIMAAKAADSLVGITEFYCDHLLTYASREKGKYDVAIPIGFDGSSSTLNQLEKKEMEEFWEKKGVILNRMTYFVFFAGRLNKTVFNCFGPIVEAAKALELYRYDVKIVYCGTGGYESQIKKMAAGTKNILFPGEVSSKALMWLKTNSLASLLSVERRVDYQNSLSNKFFEYLSGGVPILSWLDGLPGKTIVENKCGYIYNSGEELYSQIVKLCEYPEIAKDMGKMAIDLFEQKYEAGRVYDNFAVHVETVAGCTKTLS